MSKYQLKVPKHVRRQIDSLPSFYRQRIREIITALANNPRSSNAKELRLFPNSWQIRLDHYRIVYSIDEVVLIVEIVKVGRKHGPEFYADIE
ncbi:MAG: type II toxin-antitoxin system RelE/ParE family toxin [Caldilineaceae bacterium]